MSHIGTGRRQRPCRARAWQLVMIFGGFAAVAGASPGASTSPDPALLARLSTLAARSQDTLHYRETREGGLFSGPVTYTGRLEWHEATGELVQWIDTPSPARLAVGDDTVEIRTGNGRVRTLPLSGRPGLGAMMTGLRALLAGDPAALDEVFQADYLGAGGESDAAGGGSGNDATWLLHLKPRDPALREHLVLLEVRGHGDRITAIDRVGPEGERQAMTIVPGPAESPP